MTVLTLPRDLQAEVAALTESGLYADEGSVVGDALRTFFAARPDLRREVGCRLYAKGLFSLGKTAEWIGMSIEELKEELHRRDIPRRGAERDDVVAMARRGAELAGKSVPFLEESPDEPDD